MFPVFNINLQYFWNDFSHIPLLSKIFSVVKLMNESQYSLDRIDRKILSALRKDGRLTVASFLIWLDSPLHHVGHALNV